MKFSVGLQFTNDAFTDAIIKNKESLYEVYFSWGNTPNGRSNQLMSDKYTPWELVQKQEDVLKRLNDSNLKFNLLFNGNCYGVESQSWALMNKVGETIDYIKSKFNLSSITTTSPLIAKFVKANFEDIETRSSVNMEIGSVEGMDYLKNYFDGYYVKKELNRDLKEIEKLHKYATDNGKNLYLLANSGCLNNCSAHNFHNNLVSHEEEIAKMNNAYQFPGICKEFIKDENNLKKLIERTNFIRPEDISLYEPYFKSAKLATRVHRHPEMVLNSYVKQKFSGNILELLEPAHNIYPYIIENSRPLKLVKLNDIVQV